MNYLGVKGHHAYNLFQMVQEKINISVSPNHPSIENNKATVANVVIVGVWMKHIENFLSYFCNFPIYKKLFKTLKCNKNRNGKISEP